MLRDFFLPHPHTHQKAHLLTWHGYIIFILIFILSQTSMNLVSNAKPGILGTSSSITISEIINLTNQERAKQGLSALRENAALDQAAAGKASNMFSENYWAHYSPSGKTPWDFIHGAGYNFNYAGENLARNFYSSPDVVQAWMASPTHRENIVNTKYQDIGIAVEDGMLNGQKTTLVVQEFGSLSGSAVAQAPTVPTKVAVQGQPVAIDQLPGEEGQSQVFAAEASPKLSLLPSTKLTIDPYAVSRTISVMILLIIAGLMALDFVILKRRAVSRVGSSTMLHFGMIFVALVAVIIWRPGIIF